MGACVLCKEQITNPVSPQRLAEQMTTWLAETKPELIVEFTQETNSLLNRKVVSNDYCIINGKPMDICVYCFTDHTFSWLDAQFISPHIMSEFVKFFNFDITGQGYVQRYREKYEDA